MKSKRLMSAVMAGVMAVTTAIVCPISAGAEDVDITSDVTSGISVTELNNYSQLKITYDSEVVSYGSVVFIATSVDGIDEKISDSKKSDWYQPTNTPQYSTWTQGTGQSVTVDVADIISSFTSDEDWQESFTLKTIKANTWNDAVIKSVMGVPSSSATIDTRPDYVGEYDGSPIVMTKEADGGATGKIPITLSDISTVAELKAAYKKLTYQIDYVSDSLGLGASAFGTCIYIQSGSNWDGAAWGSLNSIFSRKTDEITIADSETIDAIGVQVYVGDTYKTQIASLETGDTFIINPVSHGITIDTAANGTVTADKATAKAGETVTLTVTPDTGYKLKTIKVLNGTSEVTVTDNKFTMPDGNVTVSAEFEAIVADSVSLNKTSTTLVIGGTETLVATVDPATALDRTVTWKSSDTAVATVDSTGKVTAVKEGTATITATTSNGKTASCTVTVTAKTVPATGVTVDPTSKTLEVGQTVTITGTVTPADSTDKITWKSSDAAVATVDAAGKVTAVKEGTATITATAGTKSAECKITVKAASEEDDTSDYALLSDEALKVTTKYEGYQIPVTAVAGDKITVTFEINDAGEYHQLSFKHAGEGWPALTSPEYTNEWNCVDVTKSGTFTFTLNAEDAANITANNLVVSGYSVTYTKIELNADKKPSAPGYTGDIPANTTVKQTTAVVDGKYNTRFVQKVSEDDIKGASKIVFTLSNGSKTVEKVSTKYFSSLSVNGEKVSADDGYVFLSYTVKDIPEGVTVTCTKVEIIKE